MKTLQNGEEVPSRIYYYLLDWNETNDWKIMIEFYKKEKLYDLTKKELFDLFDIASRDDINEINDI